MIIYPRRIEPDQSLELPSTPPDTREAPEDYTPGIEVQDAVKVALLLRKPLLLTGEAGVGKTELAYHLAWALRLPPPIVFQAKTTSTSRDLFYSIDEIARFHDSSHAQDRARYLQFAALGEAIIGSHSSKTIDAALAQKLPVWAPSQSVVLIDEIDKAPRDFPNDILREIDRLEFDIPEILDAPITVHGGRRPIVVITSNSERMLPVPFLRRCVYCNIPFPDESTLLDVISRRMRLPENDQSALPPLLKLFTQVRDLGTTLSKLPTTAELLDWLHLLHITVGLDGTALRGRPVEFAQSSTCLGKSKDDIIAIKSVLSTWIMK